MLQIDVSSWPSEWVDSLKNYTDGLAAKLTGNGLTVPGVAPKDELPDWPGAASVPPEKLRREELYKEENQ